MAQDLKVEVDPVKSFKEYLTIHFESYKTDRRERLTKLSGGWVREYFEPDDNYKIDVQKTNSLITPLIGFCEFTLTRHLTEFHLNEEDANKDSLFIKSDKRNHKHNYGFQDGKWVVTLRRSQQPENVEMTKLSKRLNLPSSSLDEWYDCNEVIKFGELKGYTNMHGCWEKDN